MEKKEQIDAFLSRLREGNVNEFGPDTDSEVKDLFSSHFSIFCRKCGSGDIYLNFEKGIDYGEYTGYSPGSKVIKCKSCGNAAYFYD